MLDLAGNITNNEEEVEILHAFFVSLFNSKDNLLPKLVGRDKKQSRPTAIWSKIVSDWLCHLETHKSMGQSGIHLSILWELSKELAELFCIIGHQSWLTREITDKWKLATVTPIPR